MIETTAVDAILEHAAKLSLGAARKGLALYFKDTGLERERRITAYNHYRSMVIVRNMYYRWSIGHKIPPFVILKHSFLTNKPRRVPLRARHLAEPQIQKP